jgi:hypothetical protein
MILQHSVDICVSQEGKRATYIGAFAFNALELYTPESKKYEILLHPIIIDDY